MCKKFIPRIKSLYVKYNSSILINPTSKRLSFYPLFLNKKHFLIIFIIVCISKKVNSQCTAIGGSSGSVQNTAMTTSINFSVTISPTCSFSNFGAFSGVCGITFPGIVAPYSGNTNGSTSTITYSFSTPITSADILIGYTGANWNIVPETFSFNTNSSIPTISVNSGTCAMWTIVGNQSTSPSIIGAHNSIHTVSSTIPFTSLIINTNSSGSGPLANGGSSFALCDASLISCTTPSFTVDLGNDTILCQGESVTLDATTANANYLWQDYSTTPTIVVTQPGTYWVQITDSCEISSDTINVQFNSTSTINLGKDTALCPGETLTLDATTANVTYLWQNNSTSPTLIVTQQGIYWVEITSDYCATFDTILVKYNQPPTVSLGNDTTLCLGQTVVLDATTTNATYLWQNNSINPTFKVTQQGVYWTEVTVFNCSKTDTILINKEECEIVLKMPNVFTPNDDGSNDIFIPLISKGIVSMNTIIYNRWGNKIFSSNKLLVEWSGQDLVVGTYFWIIYYTDVNGRNNNLKGYVTILK